MAGGSIEGGRPEDLATGCKGNTPALIAAHTSSATKTLHDLQLSMLVTLLPPSVRLGGRLITGDRHERGDSSIARVMAILRA